MGIKMKQFLVFLCLNLVFLSSLQAQKYFLYEVAEGEKPSQVAEKFNINFADLEKVNYELQRNKNEKLPYLLIPVKKIPANKEEVFFTNYEVSPKETLFSISRAYEISMESIKRFNSYLFLRELNEADILKIPVAKISTSKEEKDINQSVTNSSFGKLKHLVLPKETKYSISKKYGITIEELEKANPNTPNLQPGQFLNIVRSEETQSQLASEAKPEPKEEIKYVEVSKRENLRALLDKYNTSKERVEALNPALKYGGLSDGMVLKMPKERLSLLLPDEKFINFENFINHTSHEIALILPFQLQPFKNDSIENKSFLFKRSRPTRIALDLYTGAKMAVDSAASLGINVNLKIYDDANQPSTLDSIMLMNDFSSTKAIVGPITEPQIKKVLNHLEETKIPLFSPLLNPDVFHKNLVKTIPKEDELQDYLISYLFQEAEDKNILALVDESNSLMKNKLRYSFPNIKFVSKEKEQLARGDIKKHLDKEKENWFVLETNDFSLIEATVSFLFSLEREGYPIRLFTSSRNAVYGDEIPNRYLSQLQFTHTSTSQELVVTSSSNFNKSFKEKYGYYPNRFAVRGFDLMYDIILRLAYADDFFETLDLESYTQLYESKFDYHAYDFEEGVYNSAVYLIKYDEELSTSLLELTPQE